MVEVCGLGGEEVVVVVEEEEEAMTIHLHRMIGDLRENHMVLTVQVVHKDGVPGSGLAHWAVLQLVILLVIEITDITREATGSMADTEEEGGLVAEVVGEDGTEGKEVVPADRGVRRVTRLQGIKVLGSDRRLGDRLKSKNKLLE